MVRRQFYTEMKRFNNYRYLLYLFCYIILVSSSGCVSSKGGVKDDLGLQLKKEAMEDRAAVRDIQYRKEKNAHPNYLGLARILAAKGFYDVALVQLKEAEKTDGKNPEVFYLKGVCFREKKEYEKALFFLSPWREESATKAKEVFSNIDWKTQEKNIRRILSLYGQEPFILSLLADKFYGWGKLKRAAKLYHQAIIASPLEDLCLYPRLADLYGRLGESQKKEELARFFIQQIDKERKFYVNKPRYAKIFYLFGKTYLGSEPRKAVFWWKKAVVAGPEWSYFHIELASLYVKLGELEEAKKVLTSCLDFRYPREHCQTYLERFKTRRKLEEPGYFEVNILKEVTD